MRILLILIGALACGSALAQTDIEFRSAGVVPSVRLSFDIAGEAAGPRGPAAPHSGHGIEIGLSGASGDDTQTLNAGEAVVFGNRVFGPAGGELKHEADFGFFELAYRYRHFFGKSKVFGIEALGGLGFASLDLRTTSALQSHSEKLENAGVVGGFGIVWNFLPATSLQSRATLFLGGDEDGVTGAARFDVHVAHAVAKNIALRAGLVSWGVGSSRSASDDSNPNSRIRAGFGGLSLGLDVAF